MAQPQPFNRRTDFALRDGDDTDHNAINQEFDGAAQTLAQLRVNIALLQRDDGGLKNAIVTAESLAPSAFTALQTSVQSLIALAQTASQSALNSATVANLAMANAGVSAQVASGSQAASALNAISANNAAAASLANRDQSSSWASAALFSAQQAQGAQAGAFQSSTAAAISRAQALVSQLAAAQAMADLTAAFDVAGASALHPRKLSFALDKAQRGGAVTIACYGDSITYGQDGSVTGVPGALNGSTNNRSTQPYPDNLQDALNNFGY